MRFNRNEERVDAEAFWAKVEKTDSCWNWVGAFGAFGYGRCYVRGGSAYPHRASYFLTHGPIPEQMQIDHLCRNRGYVNPSHLEAVTPAENARRGLRGFQLNGRCMAGRHEIKNEADWMIRPSDGVRLCRECDRSRQSKRYQAMKAAGAALGMNSTEYRTRYGQAESVAIRILAELEAAQ
jgi:hypothetical protein